MNVEYFKMTQFNGTLEGNKKIRGAKEIIYDNVKFKSKLESTCYKKFKEEGLDFSYEPERIVLWEGFKPSISIYSPKRESRGSFKGFMQEQTKKLLNITYTPDFLVIKDNYRVYLDVKGMPNDTYPIKKKMFLKFLQERNDEYTYIFMEPHNVRQITQAIEIIKSL